MQAHNNETESHTQKNNNKKNIETYVSERNNIESVVATMDCLQQIVVPATRASEHLQLVFTNNTTPQKHHTGNRPSIWQNKHATEIDLRA